VVTTENGTQILRNG